MNENGPNGQNSGGNNDQNNRPGRNGQSILWFVVVTLVVLFLMSTITNNMKSFSKQEISYSDFMTMVEEGKVEKVVIKSTTLEITPKEADEDDSEAGDSIVNSLPSLPSSGTTTYTTVRLNDDELVQFLQEHDVNFVGENDSSASYWIGSVLSFMIPLVIVWILLGFLMRRMGGGAGGIMGVGKSNAKMYVQEKTGVTFADVAGQDEAKESLQEVVDFLHNPQKYEEIGAKLPKGALLVGSPGTGKTLLAKAVAGEANVPFFSLAGSDFVEMFVGVGASRVRDLFKEAQKNAPCIIFIDEIDAIGKSRDSVYGGGNDEREQTLNQLLAEMDGFDSSKGVLILAATNRPEILDKALLRPGRFDRRIIVDKPDLKGRIATLKVHSKNVKMDDTVDFEEIGLATAGCVGSDLANMINEAAINAVKNGRRAISQADLFESVEVVIAGKEKKDRIMSPKEKRLVAYHEVGHALVTALMKASEPVQKITIVPRTMGSLGYTLQTPEEEKFLQTKAELEARIITYMAGRAAEEITSDSITTGASNDIEMATRIARAMVTQFGMSEEFGMMGLESIESRYLDGRAVKTCGDETIALVDGVVKQMISDAYEKAKQMLIEYRDTLEKIADYLFEHETITGKEFMDIFNEMNPDFDSEDAKDTTLTTVSTGSAAAHSKTAGAQALGEDAYEEEDAPLTLADFQSADSQIEESDDADIFDEE